jgi:uncharacterized protein (DUF433 family)
MRECQARGDNMQLENYFDFLAENDIRVKRTRLGIETILWDYLQLGLFPEQIATRYPTLTLEQVYGTLTYYWRNQEQVQAYLDRVEAELEQQRTEQSTNPSPAIRRLRQLASERSLRPAQPVHA